MEKFIIAIMQKYSYLGILILIALENLFPPIPSEVILGFSGFMVKNANLNVLLIILFSTIGSIVGALILYFIGKRLNINTLKKFCSTKIGKLLFIKETDLDKSEKWFKEKGDITVFVCRFVPVVRSLISLPAGMNDMDLKNFLIYTFFGSLMWNTILIFSGVILESNWSKIVFIINKYSVGIVIFFLILFIVFIIKKQ